MPVPAEYQRARDDFYDFLIDARDIASLWSTHVAYTMTQAVFQTFRRRLSLAEAIAFANILPACLRALFVADWDTDEPQKAFQSREIMLAEVKSLRSEHNFSTENAIMDVAVALRKQVDEKQLDKLLSTFPEGAIDFWQVK